MAEKFENIPPNTLSSEIEFQWLTQAAENQIREQNRLANLITVYKERTDEIGLELLNGTLRNPEDTVLLHNLPPVEDHLLKEYGVACLMKHKLHRNQAAIINDLGAQWTEFVQNIFGSTIILRTVPNSSLSIRAETIKGNSIGTPRAAMGQVCMPQQSDYPFEIRIIPNALSRKQYGFRRAASFVAQIIDMRTGFKQVDVDFLSIDNL